MRSLLIIIKEKFLAKGLALALMDSFQSIHTTKNPFTAFKILRNEKIDLIISEVTFDTIESSIYIEKLTNNSNKDSSIIIINDGEFFLSGSAKQIKSIIATEQLSVIEIKSIIDSLQKQQIIQEELK